MSETSTPTRTLFLISNFFVTVLAVLSLLLPAKPDNVKLQVQTPVTTQTTVIAFTVENRTRRTVYYPEESYAFEKQTGDGWEALAYLPHGVIEPMYEQRTGLTVTQTADLKVLFGGPLDVGTYRLTFFYNVGGDRCSAQTVFTVAEV